MCFSREWTKQFNFKDLACRDLGIIPQKFNLFESGAKSLNHCSVNALCIIHFNCFVVLRKDGQSWNFPPYREYYTQFTRKQLLLCINRINFFMLKIRITYFCCKANKESSFIKRKRKNLNCSHSGQNHVNVIKMFV